MRENGARPKIPHPTASPDEAATSSALKQAEAALQESEERYRLLFESNPLPILLFDSETLRFLAVNESFVQHYGYSREEFLSTDANRTTAT